MKLLPFRKRYNWGNGYIMDIPKPQTTGQWYAWIDYHWKTGGVFDLDLLRAMGWRERSSGGGYVPPTDDQSNTEPIIPF